MDEKNDRDYVEDGVTGVFSIPVPLRIEDIQRRRDGVFDIRSRIGRTARRDELRPRTQGGCGEGFRFRPRGSVRRYDREDRVGESWDI